MKNRSKKARKIVSFYQRHFGYRPPYHILVCGTFCKQALTDRINIAEQLPKYMCGEVRLLTTRCALKECELGGSLLYGPYKILKQYDAVPCHSYFKKSDTCLFKTFSKSDAKYIIATQDEDLARKAWGVNIPVLRIAGRCINLDEIPRCTSDIIKEKLLKTTEVSEIQDKKISKLRKEMGVRKPEVDDPNSNPESKRQKKLRLNKEGRMRAKYVKTKPKTKSRDGSSNNGVDKTKRRKKKKVHLADHVKQALFGNKKS